MIAGAIVLSNRADDFGKDDGSKDGKEEEAEEDRQEDSREGSDHFGGLENCS